MRMGPASAALTFAVLACAAGSAAARNDKLLLTIEPALRHPATRQVVAADVPLRFGKASAAGLEALMQVQAHAVADPWANTNPGGTRRDKMSDEQVCLAAFRKGLAELQQKARSAGGGGVAGIVSYYNNVEMDSSAVYECHVGHTRAVVTLRGQVVKAASAVSAAPQAAPAAAVAQPVVSAPPVQPRPIATGYAAIDDVDAIPYLSDRGRASYKEWIGRPTPRAFAISTNGHWAATWSLVPLDASLPTDPTERALVICERSAKMPCKLYAINGSVVWVK